MGSLFAALTTSVSGLDAQSSAIGNISDNLANAQTVGYKDVDTSFEELVNASNSAVNNPGGVTATPQYQNSVQGSIVTSQVTTNLAISGAGYFSTVTASATAGGSTVFNTQQFYTREGDFTLDANGFLVNSSGYYLTGYPVDNGVTQTSSTAPIQVSSVLDEPVATSTVTYDANLPSNATVGFQSQPSSVLVYDALGNTYDMTYAWTNVGTNQWDLNTTVDGGATNSNGNPVSTTIPINFTGSVPGTISSIGAYSTGTGAVAASPYTVASPTGSGNPANVDMVLTYPSGSTATVALQFGNYDQANGLTQFADTNTDVSVTNFTQNGLAQGAFNSFAINSNGLVSINYSNGLNRVIAQIPIVQFYAEDQLQRVSGGAYTATLESGTPRFSTAGSSGAGTISSNSLEQSNVDISTEFTNLIEAQQVYSANAKVVTTTNNLLQVTINMIQ